MMPSVSEPEELLDIRISVLDESALICLRGEVDLGTAPQVLDAVEACLARGVRGVSLDLSGVTFCDCAGLNAFDEVKTRVLTAGGALHMLSHSPPVTRLLSILAPGEPPTGELPSQ